jgi:hypothetical protein
VRYPQGAFTPSPAVAMRHLFNPSESVFFTYWVKYSTNWVGSGLSAGPHEFFLVTNEDNAYVGPGYTYLTTYIEHNYGEGGGRAVLSSQDSKNIDASRVGQDLTNITENRAVSGCNGNSDGTPTTCYPYGSLYVNGKTWMSSTPAFSSVAGWNYKSSWHKVEVYFKLNSIANGRGQLDGIAQYWLDGQLLIDRRNLLFRTAAHPNIKFNQLILGPYMGNGSPVAQTMWIDDLSIAVSPPAGR